MGGWFRVPGARDGILLIRWQKAGQASRDLSASGDGPEVFALDLEWRIKFSSAEQTFAHVIYLWASSSRATVDKREVHLAGDYYVVFDGCLLISLC